MIKVKSHSCGFKAEMDNGGYSPGRNRTENRMRP